jgi:hypothetical protein
LENVALAKKRTININFKYKFFVSFVGKVFFGNLGFNLDIAIIPLPCVFKGF